MLIRNRCHIASMSSSAQRLSEVLQQTPEQVIGYYNNWAKGDEYTQDILSEKYNAPQIIADRLATLIPNKGAAIIDFCAGSGLVGEGLRKHGFTNLEAIDGSHVQLEIAKSNNIYNKYYCEFILPDLPTSLIEDKYDVVVCVGGFVADGHLQAGALNEMHRVLKPGGKCILGIRTEYLTNKDKYPKMASEFYPYLKGMVAGAQWTTEEDRTYADHCDGLEGQLIVLRKTA